MSAVRKRLQIDPLTCLLNFRPSPLYVIHPPLYSTAIHSLNCLFPSASSPARKPPPKCLPSPISRHHLLHRTVANSRDRSACPASWICVQPTHYESSRPMYIIPSRQLLPSIHHFLTHVPPHVLATLHRRKRIRTVPSRCPFLHFDLAGTTK